MPATFSHPMLHEGALVYHEPASVKPSAIYCQNHMKRHPALYGQREVPQGATIWSGRGHCTQQQWDTT